MTQAIVTKYRGPGARGSRIIASAQAGRISFEYDPALSLTGNHDAAAKALADKFGWLSEGDRLVGGGLPDGSGNCYVIVAA